jgi:predicted lipoprotein with Yx(FWY)xxD motif
MKTADLATNTRVFSALIGLIVLALAAASCIAMPAAAPPAQAPTAAPTVAVAPTAAPTVAVAPTAAPTAAPVLPTKPAMLTLTKTDTLGQILADDTGKTLYLYTRDTKNTTNCYGNCAIAWPPLLTAGAPAAGEGLDATLLGTTARTDGTTQVTYNGWPLYYYAKDQKAGDTTGQDIGGVWYVLSAKGDMLKPAMVKLGQTDKLGQILTDDAGKTLYLYTRDTKDTTNCYDRCAQAWPPLLTTGAPKVGDGLNAMLLGTTNRTDGTIQVTFNGWPLYYYVTDMKAGDITGQDVGGVWYVLSARGDKVETPK